MAGAVERELPPLHHRRPRPAQPPAVLLLCSVSRSRPHMSRVLSWCDRHVRLDDGHSAVPRWK